MATKETGTGALPADVLRVLKDEDRNATVVMLERAVADGDPDFDRITFLARSLLDTPIALVTLLDADWQKFQSCIGVDLPGTPAEISFCSHAIASDARITVVDDPTSDPRFATNPLVTATSTSASTPARRSSFGIRGLARSACSIAPSAPYRRPSSRSNSPCSRTLRRAFSR